MFFIHGSLYTIFPIKFKECFGNESGLKLYAIAYLAVVLGAFFQGLVHFLVKPTHDESPTINIFEGVSVLGLIAAAAVPVKNLIDNKNE